MQLVRVCSTVDCSGWLENDYSGLTSECGWGSV